MSVLSLFRKRPVAIAGPRFGYAVVGLGHIAGYFMDALADSATCSVAALVSGDAAKAQALAAKRGIPYSGSYEEFDALCARPDVDAVYLALPVSLHRAWTERAAAAGKHVLCEKPMASTADDARAMIAACARSGVLLSIAYRCPHTFIHQRARHLIQSGALGAKASIRIESGFGFELHAGWRDDPVLAGGGSLYDVGIYPLNAARFLLGEEPCGVADAVAVCDASGLEREMRWTSVFASGARAVCVSSYERTIADILRITGDRGWLLLAPAFSHRELYRLQGEYHDPTRQRPVAVNERTPKGVASEFRLEAEQLASAVQQGVPLLTPGEEGLADLVAMEDIYTAGGVTLAF